MKAVHDRNQSMKRISDVTSPTRVEPSSSWQRELARSFSNLNELFQYLDLGPSALNPEYNPVTGFPMKVTRSFASRIKKGDINDPLLRQVLPINKESLSQPGFVKNPVGDLEAITVPGVLHKYKRRILLIVSGGCAIHCRYCFRRNFPYSEAQLSKQRKARALDYIKHHQDITEIILSGGDPLLVSDPHLGELINDISAIPHIRRLRIHTRLPCVLPSRINAELINVLTRSRLKVVVVIHINHPNEIDSDVRHAISILKQADIPVLNQSVMLRGINDDPDILTALFETLFDAGVVPYYMHRLDKAKGTQHFEVSTEKCRILRDTVRKILPGYLVPQFVREQSKIPYKVLI